MVSPAAQELQRRARRILPNRAGDILQELLGLLDRTNPKSGSLTQSAGLEADLLLEELGGLVEDAR